MTLEQWRHYQLARQFLRFSDLDRRVRARLDPPERPSTTTFAEDDTTKEAIERALDSLHPRQARILKLRYGFGHAECTLQEIADMLDLTRERIRQIQVVAEKKLIRFLRKNDRSGEFAEIIAPDEAIPLEAKS